MLAFLLRRISQGALVIAVMAVLVFLGVYALGNPIDFLISPEADQAQRAQAIARLRLDPPLWVQFGLFVTSALHGDLGTSFVHGVPAVELILSRMPATLELALVALVIAVGAGVPLGLAAGLAPRSLFSRSVMVGSIFGFSLPNFWLGLMLILAFAVNLHVLPAGGRGETREFLGIAWSLATLDGLRHLILPALTLAVYKGSLVIPLAYSGTREAMLQDFVRFPPAQGPAPGPRGGAHRRRARAQERAHPGRHRARPRARLDDRLRGRHRDRVRLARHGQAADRIDLPPRSPRHRRLPHGDRRHVRADQPRGRSHLHDARPARAARRAERRMTVSFESAPAPARDAGLIRLWREFAESRVALAALACVAALFALALAAPWIAPQNPYDLAQLSILDNKLPPGSQSVDGLTYWLGTDDQGRDLVSAILYCLRLHPLPPPPPAAPAVAL